MAVCLRVEYGVDDRVQEAVHVPEPDEEREENRVDATRGKLVKQIVADADGVDDVDREERNPAQQKHTCKRMHTRSRVLNDNYHVLNSLLPDDRAVATGGISVYIPPPKKKISLP